MSVVKQKEKSPDESPGSQENSMFNLRDSKVTQKWSKCNLLHF